MRTFCARNVKQQFLLHHFLLTYFATLKIKYNLTEMTTEEMNEYHIIVSFYHAVLEGLAAFLTLLILVVQFLSM